jgi:hypothetical protein
MGAPKSKPAKPGPAAATTPSAKGDGQPAVEPKLTVRTMPCVVIGRRAEVTAAPISISMDSHDPGQRVDCTFNLSGPCNTGTKGITIRVSVFDPALWTTQEVAVYSASCVGGRWTCTVDFAPLGLGLSAGTELYVDAQINMNSPSDPFIHSYFNLYLRTPCP